MRFNLIALAASVSVLVACGGGSGESSSADTGAAAAPAATDTGASTGGTSGTAAPITGTTHEVKMVGDPATGYKFVPENITIKAGDGVKWTMVSGGPHNVAFQNVAAGAKAQLVANMPNQEMGELSSKMYMNPNEGFTMSFGNVAPGKYDYVCTPHIAMNMKGSVTVQ